MSLCRKNKALAVCEQGAGTDGRKASCLGAGIRPYRPYGLVGYWSNTGFHAQCLQGPGIKGILSCLQFLKSTRFVHLHNVYIVPAHLRLLLARSDIGLLPIAYRI